MPTKIEWSDEVWNPVTGCSKVSPGCAHCFAEAMSLRMGWSKLPWTPANAGLNVILHADRLDLPLRWQKPRMIFVNSMSDLFHEQISDAFIAATFGAMALAPQHVYQILTKRPDRMLTWVRSVRDGAECVEYFHALSPLEAVNWVDPALNRRIAREGTGWPLPNVWLGTSVENQHWANIRIPLLLGTPAAIRFISAEPLLAPVDLCHLAFPGAAILNGLTGAWSDGWDAGSSHENRLAWVIAGGESGPRRRPADPDWFRSLRDQCRPAGVPYFLKQLGGLRPGGPALLDGREWREMPERIDDERGQPIAAHRGTQRQ